MHRQILRWGALVALAAPAFAGAANAVVFGGSSTLNDTVLQGGGIRAFEARTGIKVTVADLSGTGKGLQLLAEGKLDVAGGGRTLTPAEKKAGLLGVIVAYDGLAVYVNKANPLKNLSRQQLKDIYTGKATTWRQVGGKDSKIQVLIEPIASKRATVQMIQEQAMDGAAFGSGFRELELLSDQIEEVARNEGAICVASIGLLSSANPAVKAAVRPMSIDSIDPTAGNIRSGAYLLSRPMLFATRGLPTGTAKALVDFMLSREGQSIVERYFVAVKR